MTIDMTNNLPKMSEEVGSPMVGISIGLPTIETYADEIGIGSISMQAGLGQDAASADFFRNIRMEGVTHACLGGRMEIAPH
jgi:2-methylaconitate cis-trans-isomerase PrpF